MVIAAKQYTYQRVHTANSFGSVQTLRRITSRQKQKPTNILNRRERRRRFVRRQRARVTENLPVKENRVKRADDLSLARSCCADKIGAIEPSVPQRAARSSIRDVLKVRVQ